jgi:GNAT superfamily N-acetyltransferase
MRLVCSVLVVNVTIKNETMENSIIQFQLPSATQYNELRESVGWSVLDNILIEKAFANSLYGVSLYVDNQLVGMGRVIGDGSMLFYIQDILVLPTHQGKGYGAKIMDTIMLYIQRNAPVGAVVGLMSSKGKEAFYERYNFVERPNEYLGSGMTLLVV